MYERTAEEEVFLAAYDPRAFDPVAVTVDVVALTIKDGELKTLLVRRNHPPFTGFWALPGTFLRPVEGAVGNEWPDLPYVASLALARKTGLERVHVEQLGTYGTPGRDPRMHVVSVTYLAFGPNLTNTATGSLESEWLPVRDFIADKGQVVGDLAFDHNKILADGVERARSKLEYTTLATSFLPEPFSVKQLQAVYEIVWDVTLRGPNFHRKVQSSDGFLTFVKRASTSDGQGGPRPRLYRAGALEFLYPPILRSSGVAR